MSEHSYSSQRSAKKHSINSDHSYSKHSSPMPASPKQFGSRGKRPLDSPDHAFYTKDRSLSVAGTPGSKLRNQIVSDNTVDEEN
jgi:hypothetical protein